MTLVHSSSTRENKTCRSPNFRRKAPDLAASNTSAQATLFPNPTSSSAIIGNRLQQYPGSIVDSDAAHMAAVSACPRRTAFCKALAYNHFNLGFGVGPNGSTFRNACERSYRSCRRSEDDSMAGAFNTLYRGKYQLRVNWENNLGVKGRLTRMARLPSCDSRSLIMQDCQTI